MKNLLFVLGILTMFCGCSNDTKEKKTFYDDGQLKTVYHTENGEKKGEEIGYYKNGNLKYKQYWNKGLFVDSVFSYSENNSGKLEGWGYVTPISRVTFFDDSPGNLITTSDYGKDIIGEGVTKVYHPNGNVRVFSEYSNDELNGVQIKYFENGDISSIRHYKNGKEVSPIIIFDDSASVLQHVKSWN